MDNSSPLSVTIVFEQSHLFFPQIIHWLLLSMFILILIFNGIPYWKAVRSGTKSLPFSKGPFDNWRFFGTLLLTIVYFLSMQYVGEIFPNTGLGFLLVSMPYMLLLSSLFLHVRDKKHLLVVTVNSLVAPMVVWYVLAQLFGITLP